MNAHLSPDDIVAAADGSLEGELDVLETSIQDLTPIARHAAACPECAKAVGDLKACLADLRNDLVPEPPPPFWDEFSARVQSATASLAEPRRVESTVWRLWAPVAAVAAAALLAFGWPAIQERLAPAADTSPSTATELPDTDPSWQVMTEVAETMTAEDVRRATAAADRAGVIGELSADERQAFVELLKLEIGEPQ